ncbi:MAG: trypsin-like peptidase domain-containing protein [Candidatus Bruticola sp.]
MKNFPLFFRGLLVTVVSAACLAAPAASWADMPDKAQTISPGHALFNSMQEHIIKISDHIKSTVVHIEVLSKVGNQRRKATGSGLILSSDGKIVTNYHVIDKAQLITVILDDKSKYTAEIIRDDQQTDLAFLKIKPTRELPYAQLADSDKVQVGEWIIAVGNPYGFDRTVSFGIVSGKGRFIPGADNGVPLINDFIQIDAMIDPGNSGGPLVNMNGEVIGINSIGVGRGQGFTIPSNIVKDVDSRLEVEGHIQRGWLGVFMQPFTEEYAAFIKQPTLRGLLVSDTTKDSPAYKAGLRSGDVITKLNNKPVNADTDEALNRVKLEVAQLLPNAKVPIEYSRNGKKFETTAILGVQPNVSTNDIETSYGFIANEITVSAELEYRLLGRDGMLVSKIEKGSAAATAGLSVGDVITKINDKPIHDSKDLKEALNSVKNDKHFLITAKRGQIKVFCLIDTSTYGAADTSKVEKDK